MVGLCLLLLYSMQLFEGRPNEKNIPIPKNIEYDELSIGLQKLVANNDITNKPIIEVKNKDVSFESYFETFLVMT